MSEATPRSAAADTGVEDRRTTIGLLVGLPLLCAAILGGWAIWRQTADLDDIEARQLAWGTILTLTREHVTLTLITTAVVLVTAIPIGILLTRGPARRFSGPITAVANAGQAAPVIGLIVLLAMWLGFGVRTAVLSLAIYGFLPVLRNTIVGLQQVDQTLVEAARGMGMSPVDVLRRVELPLAMPVIMAGVRTALVLVVGAAAEPIAEGARGEDRSGSGPHVRVVPDADAAEEVLAADLDARDLVVLKSSRDAGLRWLGDRIVQREDRS